MGCWLRMRLSLAESLVAGALQRRCLHASSGLGASGLRAEGWWIPDHKPRRYPDTPERRRQAALKYGLKEEDYEVTPLGPECKGEYPELGLISHALKDPYENWSHEHWRRNFGEPVPFEFKFLSPDGRNWTGMEHIEKPSVHLPLIFGRLGLLIVSLYVGIVYCPIPYFHEPWVPNFHKSFH